MIEAQQLVCIITCSQIVLPPLSAVFIDQFFQIANFDIFDAGYFYSKIFYMPAVPAFKPNFAAVGFNDTYFISNLGTIVLSIIWFLALQSLVLIFRRFRKKSLYIRYYIVNM